MKVKVLKKLPKGKIGKTSTNKIKQPNRAQNKFAENYLNFYDDIKTPTRKNDW